VWSVRNLIFNELSKGKLNAEKYKKTEVVIAFDSTRKVAYALVKVFDFFFMKSFNISN
jgi:hypothetical protein